MKSEKRGRAALGKHPCLCDLRLRLGLGLGQCSVVSGLAAPQPQQGKVPWPRTAIGKAP